QQKKAQEAEGWLQEAVHRKPGFVRAQSSLATLYHSAGRMDDAIGVYQEILTGQPRNFYVRQQLGELYQEKGESQKALEQYLVYLDYDDSNQGVRRQVGLIYLEMEQPELAIDVFRQVVKAEDKTKPETVSWLDHFFLGFSCEASNRNAEALAEYAAIPYPGEKGQDVYVRARIRMALVH